jgi:hypothetical protein
MHENEPHRSYDPWLHPVAAMLAIGLSYLWAGLDVVLISRRCRSPRRDGPRILFLMFPNAYLCFVLWQCMAGAVPIAVLSILYSRHDFFIYIINLGTYLMVSGEVCIFDRRGIRAMAECSRGSSGFVCGPIHGLKARWWER